MVGTHVDAHTKFCTDMRQELGENLDRRSLEKSEMSSSFAEVVAKLVEVIENWLFGPIRNSIFNMRQFKTLPDRERDRKKGQRQHAKGAGLGGAAPKKDEE